MRPEFTVVGLVDEEIYEANQEAAIAAGYQCVEMSEVHGIPLAIVGGGPSIKAHIYELANWPGHIWGVNQSAQWMMQFEPRCPVLMFTVDPDPRMASMADGVSHALLGGSCHPELFAKFKKENVRYFLTRSPKGAGPIEPPSPEAKSKVEIFGSASVTRALMPAAMLGYRDITYFGCEGSIDESTLESNATRSDYALGYRTHDNMRMMIIKAGGKEYLTTVDYYITTVTLASQLTAKLAVKLKEKSGGLLRAMVEYPDSWECVAVSTALRDKAMPDLVTRYETQFDVPVERFA